MAKLTFRELLVSRAIRGLAENPLGMDRIGEAAVNIADEAIRAMKVPAIAGALEVVPEAPIEPKALEWARQPEPFTHHESVQVGPFSLRTIGNTNQCSGALSGDFAFDRWTPTHNLTRREARLGVLSLAIESCDDARRALVAALAGEKLAPEDVIDEQPVPALPPPAPISEERPPHFCTCSYKCAGHLGRQPCGAPVTGDGPECVNCGDLPF